MLPMATLPLRVKIRPIWPVVTVGLVPPGPSMVVVKPIAASNFTGYEANGEVVHLAAREIFPDGETEDLLAVVAAGSESASAPVKAQILAPSDPGYAPTAPPKPTREQALGELTAAGYLTAPPTGIVTGTGTVGSIVRDGAQLTLLIGAPENDDIAIAVANTAADELRDVGILATVESVAPEELYGEDLTTGRVDMIVGWSRAGADTATSLASRFSCPSAPSTPATSSAVPAPTPSQTPEPIRTTSVEAPSNLSGLCDPALQGRIDEALSGIGDLGSLIALNTITSSRKSAAKPRCTRLRTASFFA